MWGFACLGVLTALFVLVILIGLTAETQRGQSRAAGRSAAERGIPPTACPEIYDLNRREWMLGWQEGFLTRNHK